MMGFLIPIAAGLAGAAAIAAPLIEGNQQNEQAKKAAATAANDQSAAIAQLSASQQAAASQAQAALNAKRAGATQDILTSPLGIQTQASTARKTLTGQ